MTPLVSIIIPVYNSEEYLERCLESIMHQDFQQWECIIVDDGSKDRSGVICDRYSLLDTRFRVVHKPNGGVSSARNTGLALAKGEWICFVDSDDLLVEDALSYMLNICLKTNSDVCLNTIVRDKTIPHETNVLTASEKDQLIWACLAYRTDDYVSKGFLIDAPHAKLFRATIIRNNELKYVDGLCKSEDALFDAQFYYHSSRIVMDTYPVYHYTINPDSICRTYKFENIPMFGILLQEESDFINRYFCKAPLFNAVLKVRAFVALEQVMYEAGADRLPISDRITALRLFMQSESVRAIISNTRYSEISPYIIGRSRWIDLFLTQKQLFAALCRWVDINRTIFNIRVSLVASIKKVFHINQNTSLSSLIHK